MIVSTSGKVPTDDCCNRPDSALLLYFSEFRTRSRNSTIVFSFQNLLLFMSVFYCVNQKYF